MPDPLVDPIYQRLPDGGPIYVETPPGLPNFDGWVAEPWNTGSAALFVVIPLVWLWVLRGRYRQHPFLVICLPILFAGGVGGVLFHGLRRYNAFFLLDVVPIYLLGFGVSIWIWIRLGPKLHQLLGIIGVLVVIQLTAHFNLPTHWAINISYASLALIMLIPLALALIRTRFRHGGWIGTALACFAIAWICRIADVTRPPLLPMGTHWLWHTFGATTTGALSIYVYRIEGMPLRSSPAKPPAA
jgi:hypothetical protein